MNKRDQAKLQRLIDRTVSASNAFSNANSALMEFCIERYGKEPGDIDADTIIDGVQGACGLCEGMTAEQFDQIMRGEAI